MSEGQTYRVSCAGCGEVRDFASMEELSTWGAEHACWEMARD